MTEEQALRHLKRGSQAALEWFIDRYGGYVTAIIRGIIGQSMTVADVEEVASDVFLAFWNSAGRVHSGSAKAYLAATARNSARNKLRQLTPTVPLPEEDLVLVDPHTPQGLLEQREQAAAVQRALLAMEDTDREIFLRYYYYYQKISQIAAAMDMKESTVKSRLSRGREKLKASLLAEEAHEGGTALWHTTSTT